ncbi:hypothetical protein MSAN_02253700 [Mycena sanguinolenta]|uniref:Uncharacterized protein n=1 Tax=Mycena sanguinolenta TaxID=230812 RepID=A0A8H7CIS1_9AGAR|nr:hypothetical protein MSAN_02253700 [Mycena sanguinolenta]
MATDSLDSLEVDEILASRNIDASDLVQAGNMLKDNLVFVGAALREICSALKRSGIQPSAPVKPLLHKTAVELERLAICVRHLMTSLFDLYKASQSPPLRISVAAETLSKVDSYLAAAKNSVQAVHSICAGGALPRSVYSAHNLIPTLCQCFRWTPPRVALWRELVSFTDALVAMDRVLPAARTFRHFLKQALDAGPAGFSHNRELMKTFWYEFLVPVDGSYWHLEVNAHMLGLHWCAIISFAYRVSSDLSLVWTDLTTIHHIEPCSLG